MKYTGDLYAILGVPPTASEDDLRQAFRVAARRFHPDVNKAAGASLLFQQINGAYEVLSDKHLRDDYDVAYREEVSAGQNIVLQAHYSRLYLKPLGEPQLLYVLVKMLPAVQRRLGADAPLNLCLVIDRSKSMAGARMQHVKSAAHRIIDDCRPADLLSMVAFSDDAEVIIPAQHPSDARALKATISTIRPDGATAMLAGLKEGLHQIERYRASQYVNHIVLITDGRTYGDEKECLDLAAKAHANGIGISGMGIGEDWNDRFLDALASQTGGSSAYISSADTVTSFLHERVRSLSSAYAERAEIVVTPSAEVQLKEVTRISPTALSLPVDAQPIPMGILDGVAPTSLMLQFHVNTGEVATGGCYVGRISLSADILGIKQRTEKIVEDLSVTISTEAKEEEPPVELLDALSKLMLYRLQDRARDAIESGNVPEATRTLEYLATRLLEAGQEELGQAALHEARRVAQTQALSEEGAKHLKYGTRALMPQPSGEQDG
jgi:Ca-activated chloride channel family protein